MAGGCSSGPSRAWMAMTLFPIRACTRCCARCVACGLAPKAGSLAALGILPTHMTRHAHRAASPSPRRRLTAREMEAQAAAAQAIAPAPLLPAGEAMAMLARRGFRPEVGRPDLPFARDLDREAAERLGELLGHYSFRLFLRGAVQRGGDFTPGEATRYLTAPRRRRWPTRWSSWASWSARHATATGSSAGRRASARPSSGTWPASCAAVWAATSPPA